MKKIMIMIMLELVMEVYVNECKNTLTPHFAVDLWQKNMDRKVQKRKKKCIYTRLQKRKMKFEVTYFIVVVAGQGRLHPLPKRDYFSPMALALSMPIFNQES